MLSVFMEFLVEFGVVKIPNNNNERVRVFFLYVRYLVGQLLQRVCDARLWWYVNTNHNK